jgi:hypothetical protein
LEHGSDPSGICAVGAAQFECCGAHACSGDVEGVRKLVNCGKPYRHGVIQAAIQDAQVCEADVIVKTKLLLKRIGKSGHSVLCHHEGSPTAPCMGPGRP